MEMSKQVMAFKKLIKDKIDEINEEWDVIVRNNNNNLDYINTITHQRNAMRSVLEELLEEIKL